MEASKKKTFFLISNMCQFEYEVCKRARDWNLTNAGHQLFIASVCQSCVVQRERA